MSREVPEGPHERMVGRAAEVLRYLRGRDWTSPSQIGQDVWGWGYHSASASPVCRRLVARGLLERNTRGHYRLTPTAELSGAGRE